MMRKRYLIVALVMLGCGFAAAAQDNDKACKLATPDELQAALGAKVTGMNKGNAMGTSFMCMGQTPTASVMLRLAHRAEQGGGKEAAGIEIAKKMGAQVDVKTFGPITCSTMIPPKDKEMYGFNTTCSVLKNGQVAAIEVTAKTQKDMVPIDKLRPVAEKISSRM